MKCYKIILNINVLTINLGSILVIFCFLCYLICLFIFIYRGIIPIRIKFRNNLYKEQKYYNLYIKYNINKMLNPPIKKPNNLKFIPNKDIQQRNKIILIKNIKNMKMNNNSKKYYKKNIYSSLSSKSDVLSKFTNEKYNNINKEELIKYNKHFEEKQSKNIYSDYELNEL